MNIQNGKKVAFNYTLRVDGQVVDTSNQKGPLEYVHGEGQIIPGLSKELEGLKSGDKKSVTISPEEAYGNINPEAIQEISKSRLPKNIEPQVGMNLQASTPDGRMQLMRVTALKDDCVIIDMNHPLAGKTLHFDVEVISVK